MVFGLPYPVSKEFGGGIDHFHHAPARRRRAALARGRCEGGHHAGLSHAAQRLRLAQDGIGCEGDQNPNPRGTYALAIQHGHSLATEAARVVKGTMPALPPALDCRMKRFALSFDTLPTREKLNPNLMRLLQNPSAGIQKIAALSDDVFCGWRFRRVLQEPLILNHHPEHGAPEDGVRLGLREKTGLCCPTSRRGRSPSRACRRRSASRRSRARRA